MRFALAVTCAALALGLAACGDDEEQAAEPTTTAESAEETSEANGQLSTSSIEKTLARTLEDSSGGVLIEGPESLKASCPDEVEASQGTEFTCRITGDDKGKVKVTLGDDQGTTIDYEGSTLLTTEVKGKQVSVE